MGKKALCASFMVLMINVARLTDPQPAKEYSDDKDKYLDELFSTIYTIASLL